MAQNDVKYNLKCGFFNGQWIGEGTEPTFNYDRLYDSEEMVEPYSNVVTDGIFAYETTVGNSEPVLEAGLECTVNRNEDNTVSLSQGGGLINHKWFRLDHVQNVELAQNNTLTTRVDSLIIQCNMGMLDRAVYLIYRQGTASQPALEGDGSTIFEFRLCNINVPSNQTGGSITIDDKRGLDECPYITGLLQQLSVDDRLNKFDQDVADKLESYDTQFNQKIEEIETEVNDKLSGYDTQFNEKIASYDSQFSTKITQYDAMVQQIQAEWNKIKEDIAGTGGVDINANKVSISRGYVSYTSGTVAISDYNSETDTLFLFINGLFANSTNDYDLSTEGVVTFKHTINSGADVDWFKFRIESSV